MRTSPLGSNNTGMQHSAETTPTSGTGPRRGTARWVTSVLATILGLLLVNGLASPPAQAAAYSEENLGVKHSVTTVAQDIAFNSTYVRRGPFTSGNCYGYASIKWELSGASSAAKEAKYEKAIGQAVSRIPRKVGDYWSVNADRNSVSSDYNKTHGDRSCPDWIASDVHDRRLGTLSDALFFAANFGGYFAIAVATTATIEVLGESFMPEFATTTTFIKGAACLGGVAGSAFTSWLNNKGWKDYLIRAAIACVGEMILPEIKTVMRKLMQAITKGGKLSNAAAAVVDEGSAELATDGFEAELSSAFADVADQL